MYRLIRLYNQNRAKIWFMVIIIVFIISLIQILNYFAKISNEEKVNNEMENKETTYNNVVSYDKQSESIISNTKLSEESKNKYGQLLDDFFTKCVNHMPEQAYELLSEDIKDNMYQSEGLFENLYYQNRFDGNKQYSFQLWMNNDNRYTYLVKVYDNMLATGKSSDDEYIEDYVTVVEENGKYVLNINSYIGKEEINAFAKNDEISIKVTNGYIYKDYEIFDIVIKNNTDNKILLDSKENIKTIYVSDNINNKYEAVLSENKDKDLIFDRNETKNISIKFNIIRRENMKIKNMGFSDIVTNYEEYMSNNEDKNVVDLEIKF